MKKILILLCLTFVLLSCTKEKIVEIEKPIEVAVETSIYKKISDKAKELGYIQFGVENNVKESFKKFSLNEGKDYYGYYIYYGPNNFSKNVGQVSLGKSGVFVLCVSEWQVKKVYCLGYVGTDSPTNSSVISSTAQIPNLIPDSQFLNNNFFGFLLKSEIK